MIIIFIKTKVKFRKVKSGMENCERSKATLS